MYATKPMQGSWSDSVPWDQIGNLTGSLIGNWLGTNATPVQSGSTSNTSGLTAAQIAAQIAAAAATTAAGTNTTTNNNLSPAPQKDNTVLYISLTVGAVVIAGLLLNSNKPTTRRRR